MEAVPRLPMISFDLKASHENASFGPKLKQYIADFYREDPESYNNEIHQLEGLRSAAVRPALDLTGCAALKRYFCQLKSLQSRFPMNKGQPAAVTFAWKDLFANIVCTLADIRFEIVCVLYNIGALHCKLGAAESRATPDSMKAACTHFQSAVWAFQHLREHYPQPSGIDLSPEVMKLFQDVCLAQAQECILEKSMQDNRKPSIVGAIGMQVLNYYKSALSALESPQSADNFQENVGSKVCNTWIKYLTFKVAYISCVVYLFQGMQSEEQQKMGERVAFYQAACDKLVETRKLSKGMPQIEAINETLTFTNDVVEGKRKAAKNENEFIYHEEVPDKDLLTEPKPASLAKGIPVNFTDPEVSGPDIFGRLVPMGAHEASSMYSEEKAKLLRKIIGAVDIKDTQLNEFMSSLQLDQLDAFNQPERLPQDLVDRCASLSVKTDAIQNLIDTMNNLADIHTEVENMLSDTRKIIQEEEANEKEYQQIMGTRPPSIVSTELSREANKYLEAHNKANESNQTLHKAMTLHLANLKVLILPLEEIEAQVPSLTSIKDTVDDASIAEMHILVAKVNEMQTQRNMLISMLRESVNSDDITSQLVTRTGESLDEIFKQEIEKHNKQVGLIEQNMLAQENILKALTDAYAKYATTRKLITDVQRKRDSTLTALITSYDTYEDLLNKSLKGLEFYRKLSSNVSRLLTRVKSTCKVQEEERSQLLANNSSKQDLAAAKSLSSNSNISIPAIPRDPTSGPKLKDFLPYMKNRSSAAYQPGSDSNPVDSAYAGQMYPPYVRPAPVGSEGTSDSQSINYPDTSMSSRQQYQSDVDQYKGYQYIQQTTGQYTAHAYPEQSPYSYDNSFSKPDAGVHYYQQFIVPNVADNVSNVTKNSNSSSDMKQFVSHSDTMPYQQQSQVLPYSQYNPATVGYPPVTSSGGSYDQFSYATADKNTSNVNNQSYMTQNVTMNNQYMNQNYPSYNAPFNSEISQLESNKAVTPHGTDISSQMQNMNISYPHQNANPSQGYASFNSGLTNQQQQSDPSMHGHNSTQNIIHPGGMYSSDPNNIGLPQYSSNTSGNTYIFNKDSQSASTPNTGYTNNMPPPYMNNPLEGGITTNTESQSQIINQDSGAQNFQYTANIFPNSQAIQHNVAPHSQNITSIPNETLTSSPQTFTFSNSENVGYSAPSVMQSSNSTQFNTNRSLGYPDMKQETSDVPPIKSHIQHYLPSGIQAEISGSQYCNPNYNSNNYYHSETPQPESISVDVNSSTGQNFTTQQFTNINQSPALNSQMQANSYQNYPGYTYNPNTGSYDYTYGYPNVTTNATMEMQYGTYRSNVSQMDNLYTNAGTYGTTQTQSTTLDPSAVEQNSDSAQNSQQYYSLPYGHQSVGYSNPSTPGEQQKSQIEVVTPNDHPQSYGNQNTLTYVNSNDTKTTTTNSVQGNGGIKRSTSKEEPTEIKPPESIEKVKEISAIDLLSGLDFSVEQKPLVPEIKVPPISEHVIRKAPSQDDKTFSANKKIEEENYDIKMSDRPPKRDLFSDPSLLNKFTQEVKSLQLFVDGFTKKTHSGITMLDSKWKKIQDAQGKENSTKSTKVAKDNLGKNASPDVFPYDDARVVLKVDSDEDYVNASHVKQISSWCIPMIVSDLPIEENYISFWQMVYQQKVAIIVCLQTEIELQGKFYGPTAKNQKLDLSSEFDVTLVDITCNVNWTERKLIIQYQNIQHKIIHYQINVFPARIVSAPLVLLVDKVLHTRDENVQDVLPKTLIHCSTGAGRSALIVLLTMVMCQVRAGYVDIRDMLDSGFLYLCGTRTNVLEDTKYLVDIYRTVLFYVQGVLCSGTVMFNGEAVSAPSGASVPPPLIPANLRKHSTESLSKFSKESFEEMKQAAGLKSGDMKDPLSYLDPLWSLKKRKE